MFGEQALRLLRTKWRNATSLAQEIYAIISNPKIPLYTEGPIIIQRGASGETPLQFRGFSEGEPVIEIDRGDRDPIEITIGEEGFELPLEEDEIEDEQTGDGGNVFPGEVVSGSGETYQVEIIDGDTVEATCLGISDEDEVPAGTSVMLTAHNDTYYFTVPLWL